MTEIHSRQTGIIAAKNVDVLKILMRVAGVATVGDLLVKAANFVLAEHDKPILNSTNCRVTDNLATREPNEGVTLTLDIRDAAARIFDRKTLEMDQPVAEIMEAYLEAMLPVLSRENSEKMFWICADVSDFGQMYPH